MIDVDHFKQINDSYGHDSGDEALRLIADVVRTTLRAGDVLGRWGGEEFLAILPVDRSQRSHSRRGARAPSGRLDPVCRPRPAHLAQCQHRRRGAQTGQPAVALVAAADTAMYAAKAGGRDRARACRLVTFSHDRVETALARGQRSAGRLPRRFTHPRG